MTVLVSNAQRLGGATPATCVTQWYVLHTRSRQEKAVAEHLGARGVEHFLPLVDQVRYAGKRKIVTPMPLFPGYVFLWGLREDAFLADRNDRLVQILEVRDQARIDWELSNLRRALEAAVPLDPYPYLKVGVRVEVRAGPMRGLQGIVESPNRMNRLVLQVDMLGRAVSVEIDASLLDVID